MGDILNTMKDKNEGMTLVTKFGILDDRFKMINEQKTLFELTDNIFCIFKMRLVKPEDGAEQDYSGLEEKIKNLKICKLLEAYVKVLDKIKGDKDPKPKFSVKVSPIQVKDSQGNVIEEYDQLGFALQGSH